MAALVGSGPFSLPSMGTPPKDIWGPPGGASSRVSSVKPKPKPKPPIKPALCPECGKPYWIAGAYFNSALYAGMCNDRSHWNSRPAA